VQRRNRPVAVVLGANDPERLERASQAAHRLAVALQKESARFRGVFNAHAFRPVRSPARAAVSGTDFNVRLP